MTNEKKQQIKKIAEIVGNVLIWAFVALSVVITLLVFNANKNDGVPEIGGKSILTIESKSMEPVFKKGDLILLTQLDAEGKKDLKVGDIITYKAPIDINGDGEPGDLNTHRIYSIDEKTGEIRTKGDNNETPDGYTITTYDVIGICDEDDRVAFVGGVIGFLRSQLGFFICIVLPLIIFFIYELYRFITILVSEKNKNKPVDKDTEEEIKRRAIEEYLKQQEQQNNESENKQDQQ